VLFYWAVLNLLGLGLQQNWLATLGDVYLQKVIAFTISQALLSTLICAVFGIPAAYLLYRKKFFGREFLRALVSMPFVLPTIIVAIALNEYALPPLLLILLAHLFLNYSIVVRTVGSVWAGLDSDVENAAALDGASKTQTFFRITIPLLGPSIASAATLVFLYCVTSFGVILLLGAGKISSIETEIYFSLTQFLDFKTAAALSIVQTIITVLAFFVARRLGSNTAGIEIVSESDSSKKLDKSEFPLLLANLLVILGLLVWPLFSLLSKFSWQGFLDLSGFGSRQLLNISVWQAAGNSLRNLILAGAVALVIGTLSAWLLSRSRAGWLEIPLLLPMGISSVVLGFGYLLTLRGGWLTIPLVQALLAVPLVIRIVLPAINGLGKDFREAAASEGASDWQIWRWVEGPMIATAIRTAAVYAALVSLGEFGSASLLSYGDQATLPVVLYQLISRPGEQNYAMAMAASTLLVVFVIVVSMTSALVRNRRHFS
jgi:thiamine transport system permease protein